LRVSKRALKGTADWAIAGLAFLALFVFGVPFPVIIIAAAVFGWVTRTGDASAAPDFPSPRALIVNSMVWSAIWLLPLALLAVVLGPSHVLTEVGVFFSKLAVVTFGGAYAVLSYMSQAAVEQKQWLTPLEMIDGLGLAETTPGPLILVTEFVGYHAGLRQMGNVWGGIAAVCVTLWMTFAPCFMFIFAGAPYIEAINARPRLRGALACITAAVVGVILNLTLWFGLQILFGSVLRGDGWFRPWVPTWGNLDAVALGLCALAAFLLLRLHMSLTKVLAISAVLGFLYKTAVT
jgi:chromate transporter